MNNNHPSRKQKVLVQFFRMKSAGTALVRLSHGAQFSNAGSTLGFIVSLFLVLGGIVSIVQGAFIVALILFLACAGVLGYVLDFQGIEMNTTKGNVRNYRSFLGLRSGDWHNLNDFNHLRICQDAILEKRTSAGGTTYSSSKSFDRHNFYTLYLVDKKEERFIKLREEESVAKIKMIASKFSELSKVPFNQSIRRRKPEVVGKWRMF